MDIPAPLILLVDNDPNALELLCHLLELVIQHAEIVMVDNGTAALAVIARRDVALVIIDYHMPDLNGVQIATSIKAASPATRVAITSADSQGDLRYLAKAIAVEYVLPKPFMLPHLQQIIDESLPSRATPMTPAELAAARRAKR